MGSGILLDEKKKKRRPGKKVGVEITLVTVKPPVMCEHPQAHKGNNPRRLRLTRLPIKDLA